MEDIKEFFKEVDDGFTIFVVEQRFAVGRGFDFFRSFKGKVNYIDCDSIMRHRITDILKVIGKHIPDTAELVKSCFKNNTSINLLDAISLLSKLFSVNEHQAAGIEVLDPIIIQEGKILQKYINQIISLHKESILRPVIIILLKDNDFERARQTLSNCPHNTNIKMIRNDGKTELYKVINPGAENTDKFLEAFECQCFSTCSNTKRNVLYNKEWAENSLIRFYSPEILQIRTRLLYRDKTLALGDLDTLINTITSTDANNTFDQKLLLSYECILKLFRVFCKDGGTPDMRDALKIAKELDNKISPAHVYRNAYFLDNLSFKEKMEAMEYAYTIFSNNQMEDHAIYCKNNRLVRQFDTNDVSVYDFLDLQAEALYNVPGLVGMSHILNNTGAALLTKGMPDESIAYFDKGLDYAHRPERSIQKIALLSNRLIAQTYGFKKVEENDLQKILNLIFCNTEVTNLPFLSARYALNVISVAFCQSKELGQELLQKYKVNDLIQRSLLMNPLGSGQLLLQISKLKEKYGKDVALTNFPNPKHFLEAQGIRRDFIIKTCFNPCSFSTWF